MGDQCYQYIAQSQMTSHPVLKKRVGFPYPFLIIATSRRSNYGRRDFTLNPFLERLSCHCGGKNFY